MPPFIDRTDHQYGRLTVIRRVANKQGRACWLCRCVCGNEVVVCSGHLGSGHTQSCGCLQLDRCGEVGLIDEMGNCYGQLIVIERAEKNGKSRDARWRCRCSCGNEIVVSGCRLRRGSPKSCGCLRGFSVKSSPRSLPEQAFYNYLYGQFRTGAIRRGHEFELSKFEVQTLTQQPCFYCNGKPLQCRAIYSKFLYSGLDRLDSDKGYTSDNVVSCCSKCNFAKRSMTIQQFRDWIRAVYHHFVVEE